MQIYFPFPNFPELLQVHFFLMNFIMLVYISLWGEGEVAQSCLTLWDPVYCNLLGFSIHGILQARILEWIAIAFSRGSSRPRDRTRVSHIGGRRFNLWATKISLKFCFMCEISIEVFWVFAYLMNVHLFSHTLLKSWYFSSINLHYLFF